MFSRNSKLFCNLEPGSGPISELRPLYDLGTCGYIPVLVGFLKRGQALLWPLPSGKTTSALSKQACDTYK